MENLSRQIVNRTIYIMNECMDDATYHQVKRCILDYCGVVLAGAWINKEKNQKYLQFMGRNNGDAPVFGMMSCADLYTAVLLNGMNAHALELDDGHRFGMMHIGSSIISAVFSVADKKEFSSDRIMRAIIAGYDISIALARHMQPGHKLKGYHATGTCCTVGTAMAVSLLLGQNEEQMMGTLSAAVTSAAGLLEVIDDGSQLKPYNVGRAAMDGIAAAFVGEAGFSGPDDIIGGKRGFYAVLSREEDYRRVTNTKLFKNGQYAIHEIYTKPYAACRHCHPAIEAVLDIRKQIGCDFLPEQIKSIKVRTYKLAIAGHDHIEIRNVNSAKMSIPYSVAAALITGRSGMSAYTEEMIASQDIRAVLEKVTVSLSEELDLLAPEKRAAAVEVKLSDGRIFNSRTDYPHGEPENYMDDKELESKLSELAGLGEKSNAERAAIIDAVWNFETKTQVLFSLLY